MAGFGGVPNLLVGCGHLMFLVTVVCHDLMARCFATLFLEIFLRSKNGNGNQGKWTKFVQNQ